jgi:site-specific DNA recombinase
VRVAIYTRISTDESMQPHSLDAQQQRLEAYVASQEGWRIVRRFEDKASGATLDRPALERMLREADAGRFELLLVYKVDRLARSTRGLAQLLEQLDGDGVGFRSASEPFDTTSSAGRMMVQMLGVFAEFERATIVERVIAGMERKASRGEWTGGAIPYGYRLDAERRHLEPDPLETPLVEEVFDRYVRRRDGATTIARSLTDNGYRTKNGKPFNPQAVFTILRNRVYLGEINYRGSHYPAPHPPLISTETFERAQQILAERGETAGLRRSNQSDYLLTGLVSCNRCGKRYIGAAARAKAGRYRYYVCFSRQRYGRKHCDGDNLPADLLEELILKQLVHVLDDTPLLQQAITEAHAELDADRPRRERLLDQLGAEAKKVDAALDRYFDAFETGALTAESCKHRLDELGRRRNALDQQRAELEGEIAEAPPPPTAEDLAELAAEVDTIIRSADPRHTKTLLQALVHRINVGGRTNIQPVFYVPGVRPPDGSVPPAGFEPALQP